MQTEQPTIRPENDTAAKTWNAGGAGYEAISRQIADAIEHCIDRLAPQPGEHVLDVATGTGWTARRVARRGADVIGVDLAADLLETAGALSPEGIAYRVGDAEALTFPDAHFDAAISTFGVMFCGAPERAAAELARVVKPGGRLALATWATSGGIREMFDVIMAHHPAPPVGKPSPFAWGDTDRLHALFGEAFDVSVERGVSLYRADNGEDAWHAFSTGYGPIVTIANKLDDAQLGAFRRDFVAYHERHRTEIGILMERPYVIMRGTRR